MRRILGLCCLLAVAGCASSNKLVEQPVTAKDVPIHFAYGSIKDTAARYSGAESSWSGMTIRRARYRAGDEFALFDVVHFAGNYGTVHHSVSTSLGNIIKKDEKVTWGSSGQLMGGPFPTEYETFLMPDHGATCVGMQRVLSIYPDTGSGTFAQSMLYGFYCRLGSSPIPSDEARTIAGAVHA